MRLVRISSFLYAFGYSVAWFFGSWSLVVNSALTLSSPVSFFFLKVSAFNDLT
jgi:hypothetical protein